LPHEWPHEWREPVIQHVSIGVRRLAISKAFYDAARAPLLLNCPGATETWLGYGKDSVEFSTRATQSPVPPDAASGLHFCFATTTRNSVDSFYQAALANGGRDNGKPGLRSSYGPSYFAAFVIDPDGYRIEAYCGTNA